MTRANSEREACREISVSSEDMEHCAREAIHLLNTVQSYGVVLVCEPLTGVIVGHSDNAPARLGLRREDLLGVAVQEVFGKQRELEWRACLDGAMEASATQMGRLRAGNKPRWWEVCAHKTPGGAQVLVELIPWDNASARTPVKSDEFLSQITAALQLLQGTQSVKTFADISAYLIQQFSGYDRVMLYQFADDWSGEVIAEANAAGEPPRFLGQHFPESDIPSQARELFKQTPLRVIADVEAEPCHFVWLDSDVGAVDQSYALLRQPSFMHIIYLKNMGVRASLTISLIHENKLWGLLSCHHNQPRSPLGEERQSLLLACQMLSFAFTSHLSSLLEIERLEREKRESLLCTQLSGELSDLAELKHRWERHQSALKEAFQANHVSLCLEGRWMYGPKTPPENLQRLQQHLEKRFPGKSFYTECLHTSKIASADWKAANVAGCLIHPLPQLERSFLAIFRPEQRRVERWGGKPGKAAPIRLPDGRSLPGPRTSFEQWERVVKDRCLPFSDATRRFAADLSALVGRLVLAQKLRESQNQLLLLGSSMEHLNDWVIITDADAQQEITYVNQAVVDKTGYSREELIGNTPRLLQGPQTDRARLDDVRRALEAREPIRVVLVNYKKSGEAFWNDLTITPICNDAGVYTHFLSVQRDVSERVQYQRTLKDLSEDLEVTLELIPDLVLEFNKELRLSRVNKIGNQLLGKTGESLLGKSLEQIFSPPIAEQYTRAFTQVKREGLARGIEYSMEIDGVCKYFELSISTKRDEANAILAYVCVVHDTTEHKRSEQRITELALYDPLTNLYNRRALIDRLLATRSDCIRSHKYFGLLYLDLDHFKRLNDTRGHPVGDSLLKQVAARLREITRQEDVLARMGGDEFVILLSSFDSTTAASSKAAEVAHKLSKTIKQPFDLGNVHYMLTCSIGITVGGTGKQESVEEILQHADLAMYRAKGLGGACWYFFDPEIQQQAYARSELEQDLRGGIEQNALNLIFQPIVCAGGTVLGCEVLASWQHPEKGYISPEIFIPLAEESQLILQLGEWILAKTCCLLAAWTGDERYSSWSLAVNISARQVQQADFVERVKTIVTESGANPQRLKLELTESLLQDNVDATIAMINELTEFGISFSLDDFGTGYSSLSYLKQLPISHLKIDKSFVRDLLEDPDDAAIAEMIIKLANTIGRKVVAEGVETEAQYQLLRKLGCDYFQGHYFAHPMPLEALPRWKCPQSPDMGSHDSPRATPASRHKPRA